MAVPKSRNEILGILPEHTAQLNQQLKLLLS